MPETLNSNVTEIPAEVGFRIRIFFADGFNVSTTMIRKDDGYMTPAFCDRHRGDPERNLAAVTGWFPAPQDTALAKAAREKKW